LPLRAIAIEKEVIHLTLTDSFLFIYLI
jgi:hypothetical protein